MINFIRYLVLSVLLSSLALGNIVVINPGTRPTTPPIEPPGPREPITVRPDPTKPNGGDFDGKFYEYCGPAYLGYRCNLMRSDGVAKMRDQTYAYKQRKLAEHQGQLDAETEKVDKDLEKLREGLIDPGSPAGINIKQKREAAAAHKANTAVISDSTLEFQETAKRDISATIDASFGLAWQAADKKDYEPEARRMNLVIGERFIKSKIKMEQERADAIEAKIKEGIYTDKERRLELVGNGRAALEISAESLQAGDTAKSNFALQAGKIFLDMSLSLNPITAWPKDLAEATTGYNVVTGEKLSRFEHTMAWVGVLTGGIGSKLAIIGKAAVIVGVIRAVKGSEKANDAAKLADKAGNIIDSAKNVKPLLGNKWVRDLPDLDGSLKEAFDGHIFKGTYEPGEILFQAQRTGQTSPGNWFGPIKPINSEHAEALFNIQKWGNDAGQIKAFVVKERVSGYAGKVAGGEGHQFFIPRDVKLDEIIEEVK